MSNELKDIANKLCPYDSLSDGWSIVSATKRNDGTWSLVIEAHVVEEKDEEKKDRRPKNDNH